MLTPPSSAAKADTPARLAHALLAPQSVAIVGQSNDPAKTAGRPLKYLRQAGYAGRIYPINGNRDTVLGERAWPSLAALPEVPEHAYVVTGTGAAVEAVEECGRLGVKVATVLADGFAEAGAAGLAHVERLRAVTAHSSLRIVGPSSLGVVNLRANVMLTANAAFDEHPLPVGRIFAASHSGGMIGALLSRGAARGIAFAGLVSVGNEVDLSLGEICAATLADPAIDGYMLFLESLRHADALRAFALAAARCNKPVLAYKLGRSSEARELAVSHTGALAGEDDVAAAFFADCGIARVETLDALIEGLPLLARVPMAAGARHPRVGVVTTTAGGATMVVDPLAMRGVGIEPPSADTLARLAAAGTAVKPARLIDLTLAGTRYESMKAVLDVLVTAPEFDLVLAVVGSSARFHPDLAVKPIIDCAGSAKPIAAYLVPDAPAALAALSQAGVPNFRTPEACADAIAAALRRRVPRVPDAPAQPEGVREGCWLDELEASALLDRLGIACAPALAIDADVARAPALPFPYPVAVKALAAAIAHKTDLGGVVLGVGDGDALLAAIRQIRANVAEHRPGIPMDRVLVQPMLSGVGEVLIGYRLDRDVGPIVMVAAGGIFTEIYRDRSLRLAPVDLASAHEMIGEVRGLAPLSGYRGRPAGDLTALAQAIVALSRLATLDGPVVLEAEINPLLVRPALLGVVAVDALVKLMV
ncbi:MAG TPA: acetate--CoA ligase family protein [Xanthobacteraceae bacterium]|jgi:acyl-CoA synthetase (NDP forming)